MKLDARECVELQSWIELGCRDRGLQFSQEHHGCVLHATLLKLFRTKAILSRRAKTLKLRRK